MEEKSVEELYNLISNRAKRLKAEQKVNAPYVIIKNELNLIIDACERLKVALEKEEYNKVSD